MIPSRRLVATAALPVGLALAALLDASLLWTMLALDAGIVLVAAVDLWLGRRRMVSAHRNVSRVLSVGRDNPIAVELESRSRRALSVRLTDDLPLEITATGLPAEVTVAPRGRATGTYHARPSRRGAFRLGDHHLRYLTPLGLWWRQVRVSASDEVRVYPDVRAVRTYDLLARQNREALSARAARLRGGETEFERLRDHQRDDPFRHIDWKATARRQKLIVREHQKERDQTVVCVLDGGRLMTAETGGLTHFDHALNATLMMGHVAARSGDQIGLVAFDDRVRAYLPPLAGPRATQRLIAAAYDLQPAMVDSDFSVAFDLLSLRLRKRALVVLFTQVVDDVSAQRLLAFMRGLPRRHLALAVLFRDSDIDGLVELGLAPHELDLYVAGAAAEAALWRERLVRDLRATGALIVHAAPEQVTPALVNEYLEIKAKQLL